MSNQLKDGKGRGYLAEVDTENRLVTRSTSESLAHGINRKTGKVWSIPFENLSPTATDDLVLYIKNTGEKDLSIDALRYSSSAVTQISIEVVTGTAGGSLTDVTPVSHTVGSAATPDATIKSSADITGLTQGGVIFFYQAGVADENYVDHTFSEIIIPRNQAIALSVENSAASITGTITLIEEE